MNITMTAWLQLVMRIKAKYPKLTLKQVLMKAKKVYKKKQDRMIHGWELKESATYKDRER